MYSEERYVKVRRAVMVEGKSERVTARFFGVYRPTVKKKGAFAAPPGYRRPRSPVLPTLRHFVHHWLASIGLDASVYSAHTMRRTKAADLQTHEEPAFACPRIMLTCTTREVLNVRIVATRIKLRH